MTKEIKNVLSLIGRCRSSNPIAVPYDLEQVAVSRYFSQTSPEDLVDFFCCIEFTLLKRSKEVPRKGDYFALDVAYSFLFDLSQDGPMCEVLTILRLITSIDRVRFGERLAHN